ncbi:MAG: hypothetical protein V1876_02760 [Candidatus Peregrinibacteria bacterium]
MTRESLDWWRPLFRCSERDVLEAFRATAAGIRSLLQAAETGLNQQNAIYLAGRLFEQRELIRQVMTRKRWQHVRRMFHIHRHQRRRYLGLARQHGLNTQALALQCKNRNPSLSEK